LKLGFGVQGNLRNYNLDYTKLTFQSQFTPYIGYSSSVPSGEGFGFNSHLLDVGLGLLLSYNETDFSYYLGVAGAHINRPSTQNNSLSFRLPPGLTFHGGVTLTDNSDNLLYGSLAHTRSEATNITTLGIVYGRNLFGSIDEFGDGRYLVHLKSKPESDKDYLFNVFIRASMQLGNLKYKHNSLGKVSHKIRLDNQKLLQDNIELNKKLTSRVFNKVKRIFES
jgi:hypothetical protein